MLPRGAETARRGLEARDRGPGGSRGHGIQDGTVPNPVTGGKRSGEIGTIGTVFPRRMPRGSAARPREEMEFAWRLKQHVSVEFRLMTIAS